MSRSSLVLKLDYHMLEGRKECVPGYEDSTGGHLKFSSGAVKLRVHPHGSGMFDELFEPYDRDAAVATVVREIMEDLSHNGEYYFTALIGRLYDQAKEHCDAVHGDHRERIKNEKS